MQSLSSDYYLIHITLRKVNQKFQIPIKKNSDFCPRQHFQMSTLLSMEENIIDNSMNKTNFISSDPIGAAIDYYQKNNREAIIAVETTVTEGEELPVSHFFRTFDDFPNQEKEVLKRTSGRVLDIGAGAGCHSMYLQSEKFDIESLDISEQACEVMNGLGLKKVICQDIWTFEPDKKYDTLLMLMNGIGMVKDLDGLKLFLLKSKELLNPEGKILLDSADIIYMYQEEDGSVAIDLHDKYHGEIEYHLKYKEADSGWFPWLYVGYEVLEDIAKECGYEVELIYADETFSYSAELRLIQ